MHFWKSPESHWKSIKKIYTNWKSSHPLKKVLDPPLAEILTNKNLPQNGS